MKLRGYICMCVLVCVACVSGSDSVFSYVEAHVMRCLIKACAPLRLSQSGQMKP